MKRIGVLISGRGSNLQSLIDAVGDGRIKAEIVVVVSNREDAAGLERARRAGIEAVYLSHRGWPMRTDYDRALVTVLRERGVNLVCLAGFMRLVGAPLLEAFPQAVLNIHPSLLPSFPGVDAQRQAFEHGVKVTGVTVHLVNEALDAGPIVLQRVVPVLPGDDINALSARVLEQEHLAYPEAVAMVLSGRWRVEGRRFLPDQAG
ncbi:MAG: phosphoribosylglycinamide formyltransferase [Vicinamibacterales bacterium]